jgi:hypothetical protein
MQFTASIIADKLLIVRFQVLTTASMMFRIVFWDVLPCKIIVDRPGSLIMEAVRTSETAGDNYYTRQYIPEDNSEQITDCIYIIVYVNMNDALKNYIKCATKFHIV